MVTDGDIFYEKTRLALVIDGTICASYSCSFSFAVLVIWILVWGIDVMIAQQFAALFAASFCIR